MTPRQRTVVRIATQAARTIRSEADANGEQPHQATAARVRRAVDDVCSTPEGYAAASVFDTARFVGSCVREVEAQCGVRAGWWKA